MGTKADETKQKEVHVSVAEMFKSASDLYSDLLPYWSAGQKGLDFLDGSPNDPLQIIQGQLIEIQRKLDEILNEIEETKRAVIDDSILISRKDICTEAINSCSAAYSAKAYLAAPDDTQLIEDFSHARDKSQDSAAHIHSNPYYWRRLFVEEALYSENWSVTFHPKIFDPQFDAEDYDENGQKSFIWDWRLTIGAYLTTIANRIAVLMASHAEVQRGYIGELAGYADGLRKTYLRILRNFQTIPHPDDVEMKFVIAAMDDTLFIPRSSNEGGLFGEGSPFYQENEVSNKGLEQSAYGRWRLSGYIYGKVEKYSGYSVTGTYPQEEILEGKHFLRIDGYWEVWMDESPESLFAPIPTITITHPNLYKAFYIRFVIRHCLRTAKLGKILYRDLGLVELRSTIIELYATLQTVCANLETEVPDLLSNPEGMGDYTAWSLREVYSWLGDPAQMSLRKLADTLQTPSPFSLRQMLLLDE